MPAGTARSFSSHHSRPARRGAPASQPASQPQRRARRAATGQSQRTKTAKNQPNKRQRANQASLQQTLVSLLIGRHTHPPRPCEQVTPTVRSTLAPRMMCTPEGCLRTEAASTPESDPGPVLMARATVCLRSFRSCPVVCYSCLLCDDGRRTRLDSNQSRPVPGTRRRSAVRVSQSHPPTHQDQEQARFSAWLSPRPCEREKHLE